MVRVAPCKTRLMVPLKTRKANLNWAIREKRNGVSPFATRRERAVSLFLVSRKKNLSDDGSMDQEHNSLSSGIVGVVVFMDFAMAVCT